MIKDNIIFYKYFQAILIRYRYHIFLLLVFIASFFIFTLNNMHEELWYDEILTLHYSHFDFATLISLVGSQGVEAHPPLYHIIIRLAGMITGWSIPVFRTLSALWSSLLVISAFVFVRKIFNFKTAAVSTVLLILNPVLTAYSQDIRMYTFAALLTFINVSSFYLILNGDKRIFWLPYCLTSAIGLYVHYFFIFAFFINFIYLIFHLINGRQNLKTYKNILAGYFMTNIASILLFLPWISFIMKQAKIMSAVSWLEKISLKTIFNIFAYYFSTKFTADLNPLVPCQLTASFSLIIIIAGVYYSLKHDHSREKVIFLSICTTLPVVLSALISLMFFSIISYRYFIIYFPFFIILFGYSLSTVKNKYLFYCVLSAMIIVNIPNIYSVYTVNFNGSANEMAGYVQSKIKAGESVIAVESQAFIPLEYFLNYPENVYYYTYHADKSESDLQGYRFRKEKSIDFHELNHFLQDKTSFWVVLTPASKDVISNIVDYNVFKADPALPPKILQYEWGYMRFEIIHYIQVSSKL